MGDYNRSDNHYFSFNINIIILSFNPKLRHKLFYRQMSEAFQKALLNTAFHVSQDNRIVAEVNLM